MLIQKSVNFQTDQLIQTHLQDCCRLTFRKAKSLCLSFTGFCLKIDTLCIAVDQAVLCLFLAAGSPQDLDDQIDDIAGLDQTFLNLPLLFFFCQKSGVFSCSQFKPEIHMVLNDLFQSQCLRTSIHHCQHIDTEGILQMSLFVKHIYQIFRICPFFEFQHNTDAFFGGLV